MIFQTAIHWLFLKQVAQAVGSGEGKIEQIGIKERLTFGVFYIGSFILK